MTQHYSAPDAEAMAQACQDAYDHRRRVYPDGPAMTVVTDEVPHFVPGMGISGEWYRIGALHLTATHRYLTVFLDAVTGQVQVEQTLMDVVTVEDPHTWDDDQSDPPGTAG